MIKTEEALAAGHRLGLEPDLVGREAELTYLANSLDSARDGQGSLVLVAGQEGIGKSRLTRELMRHVSRKKECLVVDGCCRHLGQWVPYHLFRDMRSVRLEKRAQPGDNPAGMDGHKEPLSVGPPVLPELLSTATWNEDGMHSPEQTRQNMFYNFFESLARITNRLPLLLILEDIHYADISSLQLILFLARNLPLTKLLLVATYAPELMISDEGEPLPRLSRLLQIMKREKICEKIDLRSLSRTETERLIGWYFPKNTFSASFQSAVHVETMGNPYRIRMVLESMLSGGIIRTAEDAWVNVREVRPVGLPSATRELIRSRVRLLDSQAMTVLECAAAAGMVFDPDIISDAVGIAVPAFHDILDNLEKGHRLVHKDGSTYRFDHPLISRELYDGMSDYRRKTFHLGIGSALQRLQLKDPSATIYDLALHFSRGGEQKAALSHLERAGEGARDCLAFHEALYYFESALSLLDGVPDLEDRDRHRIRLLVRIGGMRQSLGQWERSLDEYRRAQGLMQELGDDRTEGQAFMHMGLACAKQGMWSQAESLYNQSLEILQRVKDTEHVGFVMALVAEIDLSLCRWDRAVARSQEALALATQTQDKRLMARVYGNLAAVADVRGDLMEAILNCSRSLDLWRELQDDLGMTKMYYELGMIHADWHKWEKAAEFYARCIGLAERLGEVGLMSLAYLHKALAVIHLQDISEAERMCDVAQRYLLRVEDVRGLAQCNKALGMIGIVRNEWHYAQRRFEECVRLLESCGDTLGLAQSLFEIGSEYALHGNQDRALLLLCRSQELYETLDLASRVKELRTRIKAVSPNPACAHTG